MAPRARLRVLILGGTSEARALADSLVRSGVEVISSLAGRVRDPALPVGEVRIGGFGGTDGLIRYLLEQRIAALVDATHPFAATISEHAVLAAEATGIPLVRLVRPDWSDHPDADRWTWVADAAEAVRIGVEARRPFLTTGRQSIAEYAGWAEKSVLVRVVDPPPDPIPEAWRMIMDRGPYTIAGERALMGGHGTDLLVTKDSGGSLTSAKLDAAADLGVPVVIIRRPLLPDGAAVGTVDQASEWIQAWCSLA